MKYAVVFEKTANNYAAFVPDLPGCIATGKTRNAVEKNIRDAIVFHIEGLHDEGEPIPEPAAWTDVVEASV
jgi:predicted RNase H-like HicB family nuclease